MKRFACFLLTFLMIVSLVPATVLTASAASSLKTSDKAIEILKTLEGFSEKPYKDSGKEQWYIGYGTAITEAEKNKYVEGITQSEATALLKSHLESDVDSKINAFATRFNMAFTQNQHDALALFSYNCGTAWMNGSASNNAMVNAVVNGKKGNDFLNAICLYNGSNSSSDYFRGLMNRRLAEANMYLNNIYSSSAPSGYTYVVLDSNGGTQSDAFGNTMVAYAYVTSTSPKLSLTPTKDDASFLGWYLEDSEKKTVTPVTVLDKSTAKLTLTAKWQGDDEVEVKAAYSINSSEAASRNVYPYAVIDNDYMVGTLKANSKFDVTYEKIVGDIKWVYGTGKNSSGKSISGWVPYKNIKEEDLSTDTVLASGTVTATTLIVREAATTESEKVGTLNKGDVVKIYAYKNEYTATGTSSWGKIAYNGGYGWVNLAYLDLRDATEEDNNSLVGKTGKIVNAEKVNVRASAGVSSALVTTIDKNTKVTIYETQQIAGGTTWGRIKWNNDLYEGWVYMYYVQVDGQSSGSGSGSTADVAIYTGVVSSNINLNVRKNPSVSSTQVGSLPRGTQINIYEETTTNGVKWGRTDNGWVCLQYVTLTATGNTPSNGAEHVVEKTVGTITATALTLRKDATNNSDALMTLSKGDTVTIVEQKDEETTTGTKKWGKVTVDGVEGWINLAYVDVQTVTETIPESPANPETGVYGVIENCTKVNVRSAAGVSNTLVTTLPSGTQVTIYEQTTVNSKAWCRIKDGWVCMDYVRITGTGDISSGGGSGSSDTGSSQVTVTGTVNSNIDLNVRSGPGLGNAKIGSLTKGTKVTVTEQQVADGMNWGKINYNGVTGWICMSYITIESSSDSGTGVMGTVARCFSHVNVRSAPGVGNALVGTIPVGTRVEVFEKRLYNGEYWGRVAQGWVCMQYILLDEELPDAPAATEPTTDDTNESDSQKINPNASVTYSFTAVTKKAVTVHKDAVDASDEAGTLKDDTAVNVIALKAGKDGKNEIWGKINDYGTPGWINLDSVSIAIEGFVHSSTLTVYASASTGSEDIGTIKFNDKVTINAVGLEGSTVFGKIQVVEKDSDGSLNYDYIGWIDMSKIGSEKIQVTPELSKTENSSPVIKGKTYAKTSAYTSVEATEVAFNLIANADVYVQSYQADHGILWGEVVGKLEDGKLITAYVQMDKLIYVFLADKIATADHTVRSNYNSTADDTIVGTIPAGTKVTITSMAVDSLGNIWGQIQVDNIEFPDYTGNWVNLSEAGW